MLKCGKVLTQMYTVQAPFSSKINSLSKLAGTRSLEEKKTLQRTWHSRSFRKLRALVLPADCGVIGILRMRA